MSKSPSITVFTGTLNPNLMLFRTMLESVRKQTYRGRTEHIIYDGGSTNGAQALARRYGCLVLQFKNTPDEGGSRLYTALKKAKGEMSLFLESDNILTTPDWIMRLVEPFREPDVFASYPAWNEALKGGDVVNRYFSLIGSPDPTLFYLNKSDKIPVYKKQYDKGIILKTRSRYWVVRFDRNTLPTMGDNGFMVRTDVLRTVVHKNESFIHVDGYARLLNSGFATYGVVKNSIIHVAPSNIFEQIKRRIAVKRAFTDAMRNKREYLTFDWRSSEANWKMFLYIVFSLSFVQPFAVSVYGYIHVQDLAWFLHPVMCFLMVLGYGWSEIVFQIRKRSVTR